MKEIFDIVTDKLVNEDWSKARKNVFTKLLYNNVSAYIEFKNNDIEIGYCNDVCSFVTFSSDDDDYELDCSVKNILNIVSATEIIAKNYSLMIGD